jgi:hypothetical protein
MEKNSRKKNIVVIAGAVVLVITCIFILILIGLSDMEADLEETEPIQGLLASVEDDSFDNGYYGFFVWTFENRGNIISFDNLVASRP